MLKLNEVDLKFLKELLDFGYLTKEKYEGALKEQRWTKSAKLALNKYKYERKLFGDNCDSVKNKEQDENLECKNCKINLDNKQDCNFNLKMNIKNAINAGKNIFDELNAKINHKKLEQILGVILVTIVLVLGYFITKPSLNQINLNNGSSDNVQFLQKQGELILTELVNLNKITQKENKVEELVVSNAIDRVGFLIQNQLEYLKKIREVKSDCAYFVGTKDFTKEEKVELFKACIKL